MEMGRALDEQESKIRNDNRILGRIAIEWSGGREGGAGGGSTPTGETCHRRLVGSREAALRLVMCARNVNHVQIFWEGTNKHC